MTHFVEIYDENFQSFPILLKIRKSWKSCKLISWKFPKTQYYKSQILIYVFRIYTMIQNKFLEKTYFWLNSEITFLVAKLCSKFSFWVIKENNLLRIGYRRYRQMWYISLTDTDACVGAACCDQLMSASDWQWDASSLPISYNPSIISYFLLKFKS